MSSVFCKCGIEITYGKNDKPPELCPVCRAKYALQAHKVGEMVGDFSDNIQSADQEKYFKDPDFELKKQFKKKYNLIKKHELQKNIEKPAE